MTTEREKVVRALKICIGTEGYGDCIACPYFNDPEDLHLGWCNKKQFGKDMKELIEPKKPNVKWDGDMGCFKCPDCGTDIGFMRLRNYEAVMFYDFCPDCGREVDWHEYQ